MVRGGTRSWPSSRNSRRYPTKMSACSRRCVAPEERFRAGANIVVEGETPRSAFVVTRGMACRYRLMPDGRRQILTILIPGDFFDLHGFLLQSHGPLGRHHRPDADRRNRP